MKVAESIHAQYQPVPQLDTQGDIAEAEEGGTEKVLEQTGEPSAVESVQEENIANPSDTNQGPDTDAEHGHEKPPIEIKAIPQPDSPPPAPEFTETTPPNPEHNQPEST